MNSADSTISDAGLFDANRALALTGGDAEIRGRIVRGVLSRFANDTDMRPLFDIRSYRTQPETIREIAHSAVGLAKQAALPALEQLCRHIEQALRRSSIADAETLGRQLGPLLSRTKDAVAAAGIVAMSVE